MKFRDRKINIILILTLSVFIFVLILFVLLPFIKTNLVYHNLSEEDKSLIKVNKEKISNISSRVNIKEKELDRLRKNNTKFYKKLQEERLNFLNSKLSYLRIKNDKKEFSAKEILKYFKFKYRLKEPISNNKNIYFKESKKGGWYFNQEKQVFSVNLKM